ncbi:ABC transporter ATP-binding protein [Polynucleobacter sp. MG-28-Ekke-A2]|uniref:ABC transporter ATP-binding protein n=1 Tax=Polynucleobacter sp. MG-28-Ekke-A2 TaxID=3108276 RepID=UPI002B232E2B|nr:ABC transporter ATP-binding protein [Polynucleobacter sp. MG-28-Ekke-A2]MEA9602624.1 ABC transporter ATP-binding protein [Polynucleobacter sp. MG-28-Ekke-A2]
MKKVSVQCENIKLSYGPTEVLKDISLEIKPGEFFALLGPSGSGKSSLLRLIAGFNQHQAGRLLVDGKDISSKAPWERNIGMVFQSYALWPHLSVWDNVAFGLVERKTPKEIIRSKVSAALDQVGLLEFAQRKPNQLSGGQQQRVALARTIVIEPQVLLLDEPLSNLDKTLRVQMRQELLSMQRRLGLTTIFVTHDQEEAMTTADRMAVLEQGVLQQVGTPTELYDNPINPFVASFVGSMNFIDSKVKGVRQDGLELFSDSLGDFFVATSTHRQVGDHVQVSFRPQAIEICQSSRSNLDEGIIFSGIVSSSEFLGQCTRYSIKVGNVELVVDHPHKIGLKPFSKNAQVMLTLKPSEMKIF